MWPRACKKKTRRVPEAVGPHPYPLPGGEGVRTGRGNEIGEREQERPLRPALEGRLEAQPDQDGAAAAVQPFQRTGAGASIAALYCSWHAASFRRARLGGLPLPGLQGLAPAARACTGSSTAPAVKAEGKVDVKAATVK